MTVVWSPTALGQLDEIYDTIASERDIATATKWFLKSTTRSTIWLTFPFAARVFPKAPSRITSPISSDCANSSCGLIA